MSKMGPNLAARPFANQRPVKRTTLIVWIVALTLLAINVFLYQRHLSSHYGQRQAIRSLQDQIGAEQEAIDRKEAELADVELSKQNQKVVFLNAQIVRRAFSWSRLFDRLEEVLPANVELERVAPKILSSDQQKERANVSGPQEMVSIDMRGQARTGDELLEFVDNLFEHASFTLPNLEGEDEKEEGGVEFSLRVLYLPSTSPLKSTEGIGGVTEEAAMRTDSTGVDP